MANYFKLVSTCYGREDWIVSEFNEGRLRFGWSSVDANLRVLEKKNVLVGEEKLWWSKGQFILYKLKPGDIVVVQIKRPLREFLIGRVKENQGQVYSFDGKEVDFNHIIAVEPITNVPVSTDSKYVTHSFIHDITKRGQYYTIYPKESIDFLEDFITNRYWEKVDYKEPRKYNNIIEKKRDELIRSVIKDIKATWKAKDFEVLVEAVFKNLPNVSEVLRADTGKGWDLIVTVQDPIIINEPTEIPVQCKCYDGKVIDNRPIDDLERCILNTNGNIAYLVILGELTEEFKNGVEDRAAKLGAKFIVIDEKRFAELYLSVIAILDINEKK